MATYQIVPLGFAPGANTTGHTQRDGKNMIDWLNSKGATKTDGTPFVIGGTVTGDLAGADVQFKGLINGGQQSFTTKWSSAYFTKISNSNNAPLPTIANFPTLIAQQQAQPNYATIISSGTGFIYPYTDPVDNITYANALDGNGNMNPNILAQISNDEQTIAGGGQNLAQQQQNFYSYAEGAPILGMPRKLVIGGGILLAVGVTAYVGFRVYKHYKK